MNIVVASIGNLGGGDLLIILAIALLLFGAKRLPELAKGMGSAVKEFHKAKDEFEREITKPAVEMTVQQPTQLQPQVPQAIPVQPQAPVVVPAPAAPAPSETLPS
jgi:sec-independent protein translocase protein TatA